MSSRSSSVCVLNNTVEGLLGPISPYNLEKTNKQTRATTLLCVSKIKNRNTSFYKKVHGQLRKSEVDVFVQENFNENFTEQKISEEYHLSRNIDLDSFLETGKYSEEFFNNSFSKSFSDESTNEKETIESPKEFLKESEDLSLLSKNQWTFLNQNRNEDNINKKIISEETNDELNEFLTEINDSELWKTELDDRFQTIEDSSYIAMPSILKLFSDGCEYSDFSLNWKKNAEWNPNCNVLFSQNEHSLLFDFDETNQPTNYLNEEKWMLKGKKTNLSWEDLDSKDTKISVENIPNETVEDSLLYSNSSFDTFFSSNLTGKSKENYKDSQWDSIGTSRTETSENFIRNESIPFYSPEPKNSNISQTFIQMTIEVATDQYGSRLIQHQIEVGTNEMKKKIFDEIIPFALHLMTDVFGNYIIQKLFEYGNKDQHKLLTSKLFGHVVPLSLQVYGCRVIQKALIQMNDEQKLKLLEELEENVLLCIKNQNGNHVVQKCIECVPKEMLIFITKGLEGNVLDLSTHPYGCRVIQRILEYSEKKNIAKLLNELHLNMLSIVQDQYGNYVVQHLLEHGNQKDRTKIINFVKNNFLLMSQHKFASNVVEKSLLYASKLQREKIIKMILEKEKTTGILGMMLKDQYANYVIQKIIEVADEELKTKLFFRLKPMIFSLKNINYGKHLLAKISATHSSVV